MSPRFQLNPNSWQPISSSSPNIAKSFTDAFFANKLITSFSYGHTFNHSRHSNNNNNNHHPHQQMSRQSPWALLLLYRRKVFSRSALLTFLILVFLLLTAVQVCLQNEGQALVLPAGIPLITKGQQPYPDLLTRDISDKLPADLQDFYLKSKLGDPHRDVNKQASPLKLLSIPRRPPVCSAMLKGQENEMAYALHYMETAKPQRIPLSRYNQAPDDCEEFVRSRGYIQYASEEEKAFPIAFSMMMYCDVEQAERLLRSVWRPHNFYCIHIDGKADPSIKRAIKGISKCLPNVFLASKQNVVNWAAYNSLTPWVTCMNDLWKYSWKYFINLTGQEFPLKTNLQLVKTLTALKGTNIVDATTNSHYSRRWYETLPAPHNIRPYKGLVFIVVSRGFVNFTIHSQEAKDLLDWVKHTDYPDETFFSSINHNPHLNVPGSYKGNPDTNALDKPYIGRFVNWGSGWLDQNGRSPFSWPCGGKRIRGICIFGIQDLPMLINRKELFANKFHLNFQPLALDCLEEWHFNMTMFEYANQIDLNTTWYSNLDIVKNSLKGEEISAVIPSS